MLRGRLDPSLIRATRETVEHIDNIKKSAYFTRQTKFIKDMWKGVKTFFSNTFKSVTSLFDNKFVDGILNLLKNFNLVTVVMNAIDEIFKYFDGIRLIRASAGLGEDGPEAVILLILFCYQPRLRGLKNS